MSIATDLTRLATAKQTIKTAIEGKTGETIPSTKKLDEYGALIDAIPTGEDPDAWLDLDVTTWNKDYTVFYIEIPLDGFEFTLRTFGSASYPKTIDWGDGSALEVPPTTSGIETPHTYSKGRYKLILTGSNWASSYGNWGSIFDSNERDVPDHKEGACIRKILVGKNFKNGYSNLLPACLCRQLVIGDGVASSGLSAGGANWMRGVNSEEYYFSDGALGTVRYTHNVSLAVKYVCRRNGILSNSFISNAFNLIYAKFTNLTTVGESAFSNCFLLGVIDFRECTSVVTLSNTNAFSATPDYMKIVVPDSLYEDWIAETNWSDETIVGHIVKASEYEEV